MWIVEGRSHFDLEAFQCFEHSGSFVVSLRANASGNRLDCWSFDPLY